MLSCLSILGLSCCCIKSLDRRDCVLGLGTRVQQALRSAWICLPPVSLLASVSILLVWSSLFLSPSLCSSNVALPPFICHSCVILYICPPTTEAARLFHRLHPNVVIVLLVDHVFLLLRSFLPLGRIVLSCHCHHRVARIYIGTYHSSSVLGRLEEGPSLMTANI